MWQRRLNTPRHREGRWFVGEYCHDVHGRAEHLGYRHERAAESVAEDDAKAKDEHAEAALVGIGTDDAEVVAHVRPGDDEHPTAFIAESPM
jgi:hypothetical protein